MTLAHNWRLHFARRPELAPTSTMPELPEVETMRRGILEIEGSIVVGAERTACSKRPIAITPRIDRLNKRVKGQKVLRVDRIGKRVVIVMENLDRLIFEPRMTGLVLIADPPTVEHLRFRLRLKKSPVKEVLFWDRRGLGNVCLLSDKEYQEKLTSGKLGPDALAITPAEFTEAFAKKQREIKVALLDQSAVAGVGNLYASEILHLAGVHPQARCNRLSKKQYQQIHHRMVEVLELAIRGLDAFGWNLPKCAQRSRRLSEPAPGIRPRRRKMPYL